MDRSRFLGLIPKMWMNALRRVAVAGLMVTTVAGAAMARPSGYRPNSDVENGRDLPRSIRNRDDAFGMSSRRGSFNRAPIDDGDSVGRMDSGRGYRNRNLGRDDGDDNLVPFDGQPNDIRQFNDRRNNGSRFDDRRYDDRRNIEQDSEYDNRGFDVDEPRYDSSDRLQMLQPRELFRAPTNPPVNRQPGLRPLERRELSAQESIARRYKDPGFLRFLNQLPPEQGVTLYGEVLNLIATRHLEPPALSGLVERGMQNVLLVAATPVAAQTLRIQANGQQYAALEAAFGQAAGQLNNLQRSNDAVSVLRWSMQQAQQFGVPGQVVAAEFIYGAVESLDKYSAFVPPEAQRAQNQQLGQSLVGIGVQIEKADDGMRVLKVIPQGPAATSGVQRGDVIVAADGKPLRGRDLDEATSLITGPAGSPVVLELQRQGVQTAEVTVMRASVQLRSVEDVQLLDPSNGVGYLKLDTFAQNSASEMEAALWQLHQQGMRSLVVDLRGDPGGLLTTAIDVAGLFVKEGTIVSTRGRTESDNSVSTASRAQVWKVPLVVLVDENSASASEILAAAIQENGRGVIVGRRTYGKGTVQTLFPLNSVNAGLRLTTARFFSPNGRAMAGEGVEPDVAVANGKLDPMRPFASDVDIRTAVSVAREVSGGSVRPNGQNLLGSNIPAIRPGSNPGGWQSVAPQAGSALPASLQLPWQVPQGRGVIPASNRLGANSPVQLLPSPTGR